ncbi:MAG: TlpA disulfide reductase family protein [Nitriliruptoraceae bacterium]
MLRHPGCRLLGPALAVLLLSSCSGGDDAAGFGDGEPVDFGSEASDEPADLPDTDEVSVADAPEPDAVPPRDARLVSGGWPEAAAFIAREAEDGNPTLVNIFASWCVPCRSEMPLLLDARDENPEVTFLGIDHVDRLEDGEAFVDELGVDLPTIHDLDGDVAAAIGARAMPTTAVFDRDGQLVARVVGELNETSLGRLLDEVR